MNGPARARDRYPVMYASKGMYLAKTKQREPIVRRQLPMILQTCGPWVSRIVPMGSAARLAATAAVVNIRFKLGCQCDRY